MEKRVKAPKITPEEKAAKAAAKKAIQLEKKALKAEKAAEKAAAKQEKLAEKPKKEKVVKEKPKKEKVVKEKPQKGTAGFNVGISIRAQLIIGFLIPIAFCVLIGVISYDKASEGLIENYESSSMTALEMTMTSLDEAMNTVQSIVMELSQDTNVSSYSLGGLKNDSSKESLMRKNLRTNLAVKEVASEMIDSVHIVPVQDVIVLTSKTLDWDIDMKSFMGELMESEDAYIMADKRVHWYSYHPFIDTKLGTDTYLMFCSRIINSGSLKAVVIVDVNKEAVGNLLNKLDFGEGSYVSFVTAEGAEVSTDPEFSVTGVEGVDWAVPEEGAEEEIMSTNGYVDYNGKNYFYMMVKSEVTGGKMLALVPKAHITQSSDAIRNLTIPLVIVACIVAVVLAGFIIIIIGSNISKSVSKLDRVSRGDLTESGKKEKTARNEFGKLQGALTNTVVKMRGLIGTVSDMKDAVLVSGDKVMDSGVELSTMTENVSAQMEEINSIIATQNEAIADCSEQMEELSVQIKGVSKSIFATIDEVNSSQKMIDEGMNTVNEMVDQSAHTAEATKEVQDHVAKLANKLGQISDFVENIQEIASQTNLLSLNASIEAARAGEQGRGFSVVAEEIRKLADNSGQTAVEINKIIEEITKYTQNALKKVGEAESISSSQMESAKKTIAAFEQMNSVMEGLVGNMQGISQNVDEMNTGRHSAMKAIRGIGESSESTVEATAEVNRFLEKQMEAADSLKGETMKMQKDMKQLEEAIQTFKL